METPKYLQVLWSYKWLLLFGAVVAALAGFFAGFAVVDGQPVSRAQQTWSASTTMLLTSNSDRLYQSEVPGVPLQQNTSEPQFNDMASTALVYAYIMSSDLIETAVEAKIGALDDETESISALRRTTQPTGDERFPGRLDLPVLEAVGTAPTPERAELISQTAAAEFTAYVVAQQDAQGLAPELRVRIEPLGANPAVEGESSNPAIPVVVTAIGVFLAFVVLAFAIAGIRAGAAKRKTWREAEAGAEGAGAGIGTDVDLGRADTGAPDEMPLDDVDESRELAMAGAPRRRTGRTPRRDEDETA